MNGSIRSAEPSVVGSFAGPLALDVAPARIPMASAAGHGKVVRVTVGKGVAVKTNNPGNVKFDNQPGARRVEGSPFAWFDTPEEGFRALERQTRMYQTGESKNTTGRENLKELVNIYLGINQGNPDRNDPVTYLRGMVSVLKDYGVTPKTLIRKIPTTVLAEAFAWMDSNSSVERQ